MSFQVKALSGAGGASGRGPSPQLTTARAPSSARFFVTFFVGLFAFVALGCSSKLPGPTDCERVALRASGIHSLDQLRFPHVREAVQTLTHECLTTPFDLETVRCMEEVGAFQICVRDFVLRHPERVRRTGR